ncbi:hypothetical protein PG984_005812 [Apiospora sp. TS-2023a]
MLGIQLQEQPKQALLRACRPVSTRPASGAKRLDKVDARSRRQVSTRAVVGKSPARLEVFPLEELPEHGGSVPQACLRVSPVLEQHSQERLIGVTFEMGKKPRHFFRYSKSIGFPHGVVASISQPASSSRVTVSSLRSGYVTGRFDDGRFDDGRFDTGRDDNNAARRALRPKPSRARTEAPASSNAPTTLGRHAPEATNKGVLPYPSWVIRPSTVSCVLSRSALAASNFRTTCIRMCPCRDASCASERL